MKNVNFFQTGAGAVALQGVAWLPSCPAKPPAWPVTRRRSEEKLLLAKLAKLLALAAGGGSLAPLVVGKARGKAEECNVEGGVSLLGV